jgi:hypothetical protein
MSTNREITRSTVLALAAEWESTFNLPYVSEEETYRIGDRQGEIEEELAKTPAASMADAVAKARVLAKCESEDINTAELGLAASLLADLDRMAGGAS